MSALFDGGGRFGRIRWRDLDPRVGIAFEDPLAEARARVMWVQKTSPGSCGRTPDTRPRVPATSSSEATSRRARRAVGRVRPPDQCGYDPDHPLARGRVGKVGVPVSSIEDMEALFEGIPLEKTNTP